MFKTDLSLQTTAVHKSPETYSLNREKRSKYSEE